MYTCIRSLAKSNGLVMKADIEPAIIELIRIKNCLLYSICVEQTNL